MNTNGKTDFTLFIINKSLATQRGFLTKNAMENIKLTKEEMLFCQLLVNGSAPYGGDAVKCYQEVFRCNDILDGHKAKKFMARTEIQEYITELETENVKEAAQVKKFLAENLKSIIKETSTAQYSDRRGTKLSPAPLRSVAVSASKALMELYPVREAQVNKLNIEGDGENGIVFNVIVPGNTDTQQEGE